MDEPVPGFAAQQIHVILVAERVELGDHQQAALEIKGRQAVVQLQCLSTGKGRGVFRGAAGNRNKS